MKIANIIACMIAFMLAILAIASLGEIMSKRISATDGVRIVGATVEVGK